MASEGLHGSDQVVRQRLEMESSVDVLVQQSKECLEGWGFLFDGAFRVSAASPRCFSLGHPMPPWSPK